MPKTPKWPEIPKNTKPIHVKILTWSVENKNGRILIPGTTQYLIVVKRFILTNEAASNLTNRWIEYYPEHVTNNSSAGVTKIITMARLLKTKEVKTLGLTP